MMPAYRGRFAPSPTGPLHAGSLVAAVASYLDARANDGAWLLRMEDIDEARALPDAAQSIMQTLQAHGMQWDEKPVWQSRRKAMYQAAFERLGGAVYACGCSRREIADSRIGVASDGAAVYPGTCRGGLAPGRAARAWRLQVPDQVIAFDDRWAGPMRQRLATEVGDFVLRRADGYWAYQLAVVVDEATAASPTSCAAPTCSTRPRARSICRGCSACRRRASCMCRCWSMNAGRSYRSRPVRRLSTAAGRWTG